MTNMREQTLAALEDEPLDGYRAGRRMESRAQGPLRGQFRFDWAAVYPTLHELEADGLLESFEAAHGERARRMYRITEAGQGVLDEARRKQAPQPDWSARPQPEGGVV